MGKELRARFIGLRIRQRSSYWGIGNLGCPSETATPAEYVWTLDGTIVAQAISHGIVTKDECDAFQEATKVWKGDPGAFAAFAWGECLGLKP